jgi:penicillin-binding protein 1A
VFKENPALACRDCAGSSDQPVNQVVDGFNFGAPAQKVDRRCGQGRSQDRNPGRAGQPGCPHRPARDRRPHRLPAGVDDARRGPARYRRQAKVLGREDVGGKTGSTNDHRDAWFSGFGGPYVTTVWVGRDDFRSLGYREYGGKAALPIWIDYMRTALKDTPIAQNEPPSGMVQATLNGATEWVKVEDMDRLTDYDLNLNTPQADAAAFDIF